MSRIRVPIKTIIFLLFAIASTASAQISRDLLNDDPVLQEQEIRAQMQAQQAYEAKQYEAQQQAAAGQQAIAEPTPPRHFEGERAVGVRAVPMTPEEVQAAAAKRYADKLERYKNALERGSANTQSNELDEEARKSSGMSRADWEARKSQNNPFENGFFNRRTNIQNNNVPVTAERTSAPAPSIPPLQDPNAAEFKVAAQRSRQAAIALYPQCADPSSELSKKMVEIAYRLEAQGNNLVYQVDAPERIADIAFAELTMSSRIAAGEHYPQLGDPNSELTKKYLEIVKRLADVKSPIMNDSHASERIADMAAGELKK